MPRSKWFAAAGTAAAITMIMAPATHAASAPSPTAPARAAAVTTLYYDSTGPPAGKRPSPPGSPRGTRTSPT